MTKLEFNDLYRFLVSLGTVLIAMAFLIPWLFLQGPFDLQIPIDELSELTSTAKTVVEIRQATALWFLQNLKIISIVFGIIGFLSLSIGLVLWGKKQKQIDEKEDLEKIKLSHEVRKLTPTERAVKAISEAQEEIENQVLPEIMGKSETNPPSNEVVVSVAKEKAVTNALGFAKEYLEVEEKLINKIQASSSHFVLSVLDNIAIQSNLESYSDLGFDILVFSHNTKKILAVEVKLIHREITKVNAFYYAHQLSSKLEIIYLKRFLDNVHAESSLGLIQHLKSVTNKDLLGLVLYIGEKEFKPSSLPRLIDPYETKNSGRTISRIAHNFVSVEELETLDSVELVKSIFPRRFLYHS